MLVSATAVLGFRSSSWIESTILSTPSGMTCWYPSVVVGVRARQGRRGVVQKVSNLPQAEVARHFRLDIGTGFHKFSAKPRRTKNLTANRLLGNLQLLG